MLKARCVDSITVQFAGKTVSIGVTEVHDGELRVFLIATLEQQECETRKGCCLCGQTLVAQRQYVAIN